jgi:excisionase family DNA binding protein
MKGLVMPNEISGQLYSRNRVASLLDVSLKTLERKIAAGDLRAVKIGRLVRIPASEIARLTASNSEPTVET